MVNYSSLWYSDNILCHRCHKNLRGISLKNIAMAKQNLSLDLCANCIAEIAYETKDFRS